VFCLLLAVGTSASAQYPDTEFDELNAVQRLYLDEVVAGGEGKPSVELYLRAETRYGEPVETLRAVDLAIRDNGEAIDATRLKLEQIDESGRGTAAVVVLDRSQRTQTDEAFERARQALEKLIAASAGSDRIALVSFGGEPRLETSLDAPREELKRALRALQPAEEAADHARLYDAIELALAHVRSREAPPRRAFVIVFTGGPDEGSTATLETLIERGRGDEFEARIPVFTVGYSAAGRSQGASLQALSEGTAAKSFQARSPIHLASLFQEIWRQMARSYLVHYGASLDGEVHKIEISVEDHSDMRMVQYPSMGAVPYSWWIGGGAVAVAALVGYRIKRRSRLMGRLLFVGGQESGREVILRGPDVRIGALPENDIVVGSGAVSRKHAVLRLRGGSIEIEDLETRNGTYVNGSPVSTAILESGDKVRIADVDMVYEK
jgi:hypothetical protein